MAWIFECPICKTDEVVPAQGPKQSKVLFIGDQPGVHEIAEGKPFVGPTGGVLRSELGRLEVDINQIRMMNMWLHKPNGNTQCQEHGIQSVIAESTNKSLVVLFGSETVKYFCKLSVELHNGLVVPCPWWEAKTIACVQPAVVFHSTIGELRFALSQIADVIGDLS